MASCSGVELGKSRPEPPREGIYLEVLGEDPNRIFISFPGVSFQGIEGL